MMHSNSPSGLMASGSCDRPNYLQACAEGKKAYFGNFSKSTVSSVNVNANEEAGFKVACTFGHLPVIRELLRLERKPRVSVHAKNEEGFWVACKNGHVGAVRELLTVGGDR